MANSMIGGVLKKNVWYVDSGASNHMTSHEEWFRNIKDLKTLGFVETSDDTTHPITQINKVPLSTQDGQTKYLKDVFHVPTITKKFVFISQMVEQSLQMTFNLNGCFVEDMKNQSKLIAKREKNGRMFTLDVTMLEVNSMLFTMEKELETLEFGTSGLAMLISNILNRWKNRILLKVFPNLEQKR
jgi:hypothetical protein